MNQTFFEEIQAITEASQKNTNNEYFTEEVISREMSVIKNAALHGFTYELIHIPTSTISDGELAVKKLEALFPGFDFSYINTHYYDNEGVISICANWEKKKMNHENQTFMDEIKALTKKSREQLIHEYFNESVLNNIKNAIRHAAEQGEDHTTIILDKVPCVLSNYIKEIIESYFLGIDSIYIKLWPTLNNSNNSNDLQVVVSLKWNIKEEEEYAYSSN